MVHPLVWLADQVDYPAVDYSERRCLLVPLHHGYHLFLDTLADACSMNCCMAAISFH